MKGQCVSGERNKYTLAIKFMHCPGRKEYRQTSFSPANLFIPVIYGSSEKSSAVHKK